MGEAKRRKEIALRRNPDYNSDPLVPWTKTDWEKVVTVFGKLSEPDYLTAMARKQFQHIGRGLVLLCIYKGKPTVSYSASYSFLLFLYESGFKNRLQETLCQYNPRIEFILLVTYNDVATEAESTYDYIPCRFGRIPSVAE